MRGCSAHQPRSLVYFQCKTECVAAQLRSLVYFQCKTECVAAQRINHALWYTSNVKPDAWLLSASTTLFGILPMQNRMCGCLAKEPIIVHHLNQTNHSSSVPKQLGRCPKFNRSCVARRINQS
jgi:hypothetical protein